MVPVQTSVLVEVAVGVDVVVEVMVAVLVGVAVKVEVHGVPLIMQGVPVEEKVGVGAGLELLGEDGLFLPGQPAKKVEVAPKQIKIPMKAILGNFIAPHWPKPK